MSKISELNGISQEDFEPSTTAQEIAEDAYLLAEYNTILIEQLMEV